ncbi:MAG TPA: DNA alkylation repair protein, partial [Gemmatimonadaceae bacterium]
MTTRTPTAAAALKRLREFGDTDDARFLQRFFKTGPGEYGAGDRFLGVRLPNTRRVAREFRDLQLSEIEVLLHEPWHEARLLAVILLGHAYERGTPAEKEQVFRLYVRNAKRVNNWDLVDASAAHVVGRHLFDRPRTLLDKLARSKNLWERRISIIATYHFIRQGQHDDTIRISRLLMRDTHDLIHKATGWMLREMGKRDG